MADLEATVASHLATLGKELEEPMTRLIQTASETPRAAAEVIGHLRQEISNNIERDNSLLEERRQIMQELNTLSLSLEQASAGQREAIEQLVNASTGMLQDVSERFTGQVDTELTRMTEAAENFAGSATEISSLGEAFGLAVTLFSEANGQLIDSLGRIESAMGESTSRSDEQMGYYVAQAREIIDQSMSSQREIFEELRQLGKQDELMPVEAS
jgi:methyl-accepting chemotaxis protein